VGPQPQRLRRASPDSKAAVSELASWLTAAMQTPEVKAKLVAQEL
jgi:hypothetical protein